MFYMLRAESIIQKSGISVTAALIFFGALSARADSDSSTCLADAETARLACTTTDTVAGMPDGGAQMNQLLAQVKAGNAQVGTTGSAQSSQCSNQADVSQKLSAVSALKAQACTSAFSQCSSSCTQKSGGHQALADMYNLIGDSQNSQKQKTIADSLSSNSALCTSYQANASQAGQQAVGLLQNAGINQSCLSATKQAGADTAGTVDVGGEGAAGVGAVKLGNGAAMPIGAVSLGSADDGGSGGGGGGSIGGSGQGSVGGAQLASASGQPGSGGAGGNSSGARLGGATQNNSAAGLGGKSAGDLRAAKSALNGGGLGASVVNGRGGLGYADRADPSRGLSTDAVSSGVTGATGPSLWEKVSRRYKLQQGTLINEELQKSPGPK